MIDYDLVPEIVKELKRVARHCAGASTCSGLGTIIELAQIDPQMYWVDRGSEVEKFLIKCLKSFDENVQFTKVRCIEPDEFKQAMTMYLGLTVEWLGVKMNDRSMETMDFLRLPYTYSTWRKYREILFEALAKHILEYTA
jgi:hypothetical protein